MQPAPPSFSDPRYAWVYRLLGVTLYVVTIIFTYWLFTLYDQGADLDAALLPALGAIAAPLFAIGMAATAPDFIALARATHDQISSRSAGSSSYPATLCT